MAEADYNVADRQVPNGSGGFVDVSDNPVTAADKIAETVQATPDQDAKDFAEAQGVSHPAYANYATALNAHAARADIEGLAERRAREYGDAFSDADFMRQNAYNADGTAATPPRPGTVHGDAPAAS